MEQNPQETADLVRFTEEILNGRLHFFVQCFDHIKSQIFLHRKSQRRSYLNLLDMGKILLHIN